MGTPVQWTVAFLTLSCLLGKGEAGLKHASRLERATPTPVQGLSLLDLPVFSRGDRPNMMDKTLGAIFSKVAFNQPNNSAINASTANTRAGNEVLDKNSPGSAPKLDAVNKTQESLFPAKGLLPPPFVSTATAKTASLTTTETIPLSVTTPSGTSPFRASSAPKSTTTAPTEAQTKLDFVPFDQWNKHYQVPGLRGPSRINTAKDPDPQRESFFPPFSFTTPSSTSTSRITAPRTAPTTPSTTTTTKAATATSTSTTAAPTTVPRKAAVPTTALPTEPKTSKGSYSDGRQAAWGVHVYATAALFTLLGVFSLSSLLRLRSCARRLLPTTYCIVVQLLLLFVSITRTIHLLYDPYNARRLLPPALALALFNVTFPCLTAAFAVLLLVVVKITRLQVLPAQLVKPALLAGAVAFHFLLSLTVDIVVGSVGGLFSLHLASQAYFVLWALTLSLGYLAAFGPAFRAATVIQSDMMRSTLAALHINGAALPRRLPRPTLVRAIRVTLAAAVIGLLVAAFQLYGMFGVYGLPWRQQVGVGGSTASNSVATTSTSMATLGAELPAPEWLRSHHRMKRDAQMEAEDDGFEDVVVVAPALPSTHKSGWTPGKWRSGNALIWPVAAENFWPWWTYQLIARLLEFVMAMLMAYVASQPQRQHESVDVSKKGAAAFFKALPSTSLETLSSMCFGGAAMGGAPGKRGDHSKTLSGPTGHPPLSPVKSLASEEDQFPAVCNSNQALRNYCYASAPTQLSAPSSATLDRTGRQVEAHLYGSKRRSQRSNPASSSSMLYNDQGFLRFRENGDPLVQAYEELDHAHKQHQQHIYQELRPEMGIGFLAPPTPSASSFSGSSSCTWSQAPSKILTRSSEPTDTPSTCTYEQLYSRGLAGCYEPNRYAARSGSRRNYESYGPAPQAQTPNKVGQDSLGFKKGEQILQGSLMENYVHMLLAAQAHRQCKLEKQDSTDLDGDMEFDGDDGLEGRTDTGSFHDLYVSQCASTCSSESAANSFDLRLYPHNSNSPNKRCPRHNLVSPDDTKISPFKRSNHFHQHSHTAERAEVRLALPNKKNDYPMSLNLAPPTDGSAFVLIGGGMRKHNKAGMSDISPDSAIVADIAQTPTSCGTTPTADIIGKFPAMSTKPPTSPLAQFFRFSSFSFGDKSYVHAKKDKELTTSYDVNSSTTAGKFLHRFCSSASLNSASQYGYSPLVGSEDNLHQSCVSLRRSTSENEVESLRDNNSAALTSSPPRHCSGCADNGETLCPFLNEPRLCQKPSADYWLSPELLRKHTTDNGCNVFAMLHAGGVTEDGTQTTSSFEYGDRSFPTSLSDLEALQDGDNEVNMVKSKCVHSNGQMFHEVEAQFSSSEEESVV